MELATTITQNERENTHRERIRSLRNETPLGEPVPLPEDFDDEFPFAEKVIIGLADSVGRQVKEIYAQLVMGVRNLQERSELLSRADEHAQVAATLFYHGARRMVWHVHQTGQHFDLQEVITVYAEDFIRRYTEALRIAPSDAAALWASQAYRYPDQSTNGSFLRTAVDAELYVKYGIEQPTEDQRARIASDVITELATAQPDAPIFTHMNEYRSHMLGGPDPVYDVVEQGGREEIVRAPAEAGPTQSEEAVTNDAPRPQRLPAEPEVVQADEYTEPVANDNEPGVEASQIAEAAEETAPEPAVIAEPQQEDTSEPAEAPQEAEIVPTPEPKHEEPAPAPKPETHTTQIVNVAPPEVIVQERIIEHVVEKPVPAPAPQPTTEPEPAADVDIQVIREGEKLNEKEQKFIDGVLAARKRKLKEAGKKPEQEEAEQPSVATPPATASKPTPEQKIDTSDIDDIPSVYDLPAPKINPASSPTPEAVPAPASAPAAEIPAPVVQKIEVVEVIPAPVAAPAKEVAQPKKREFSEAEVTKARMRLSELLSDYSHAPSTKKLKKFWNAVTNYEKSGMKTVLNDDPELSSRAEVANDMYLIDAWHGSNNLWGKIKEYKKRVAQLIGWQAAPPEIEKSPSPGVREAAQQAHRELPDHRQYGPEHTALKDIGLMEPVVYEKKQPKAKTESVPEKAQHTDEQLITERERLNKILDDESIPLGQTLEKFWNETVKLERAGMKNVVVGTALAGRARLLNIDYLVDSFTNSTGDPLKQLDTYLERRATLKRVNGIDAKARPTNAEVLAARRALNRIPEGRKRTAAYGKFADADLVEVRAQPRRKVERKETTKKPERINVPVVQKGSEQLPATPPSEQKKQEVVVHRSKNVTRFESFGLSARRAMLSEVYETLMDNRGFFGRPRTPLAIFERTRRVIERGINAGLLQESDRHLKQFRDAALGVVYESYEQTYKTTLRSSPQTRLAYFIQVRDFAASIGLVDPAEANRSIQDSVRVDLYDLLHRKGQKEFIVFRDSVIGAGIIADRQRTSTARQTEHQPLPRITHQPEDSEVIDADFEVVEQ